MPLQDVLVHRATPMKRTLADPFSWADGERPDAQVAGIPFDCLLLLPAGTEDNAGRGRKVTAPTLFYGDGDDTGAPIALRAEDELLVVAPELNIAQGDPENLAVRWLVNGAPLVLARPGDDAIGAEVKLRRVDD